MESVESIAAKIAHEDLVYLDYSPPVYQQVDRMALERAIAAALRAERAKLEKFAAALKSLKKYEPLVYDERDEHGVLSYAEMDETPSGEWVRFSDIEGAMK